MIFFSDFPLVTAELRKLTFIYASLKGTYVSVANVNILLLFWRKYCGINLKWKILYWGIFRKHFKIGTFFSCFLLVRIRSLNERHWTHSYRTAYMKFAFGFSSSGILQPKSNPMMWCWWILSRFISLYNNKFIYNNKSMNIFESRGAR